MLRRLLSRSFISAHNSSPLRDRVHYLTSAAPANTPEYNKILYAPLSDADPEVQEIIDKETWRQYTGLELIASENLISRATTEAIGSILANKVSEGLPNARHHGGNKFIDELETLCQRRALEAFYLDPVEWGVNVQPYSGTTANFAVMTALIQPQDRLMGLGMSHGGHLSHGHWTAKKKITASSIYFQSFPYALSPQTDLVDYTALAAHAEVVKPRLIVCGGSAYTRDWDYAELKKIADKEGAWLVADIAHISGLIAAQQLNDPFPYCDIVTTTMHKTLRGPRAGLIFFRKNHENAKDLEKRVNEAVFPACQGGPHNNTIAGVATALRQASQPTFRAYAKQVISNAQTLASSLLGYGYKLQTGGTDNHLILWDLRPLGLTGSKVEKVCDIVGITINRNTISGDLKTRAPGGIRLGTSAITSRNMLEADVKVVAELLHRTVQLSLLLQKEAGTVMLKDVVRVATKEGPGREGFAQVKQLRKEVREFAMKWPLPGVDIQSLRKPKGFEDE